MSQYGAEVVWERGGQDFAGGHYSRAHRWRFDGGLEVAASASPQIVPLPFSDAAAVDPEEAFVASLASCHMLFFLSLPPRAGGASSVTATPRSAPCRRTRTAGWR